MIPSSSLRRSYNYNDDPNPNSSPQEDPPPLSLDHFPSPFIDHHHDHNQLLFFTHDNINSPQPDQQLMAHDDHIHGGAYINIPADQNTQDISMINTTHDDHPTPSSKLAPKMIKKTTNKGSTKKQRKSGKKDRHSKICTAQGIRDRRMRLSLQIARKFFDLQDMLGFDKASKTIDWLFSKSKKAIKKLSCTTTNDHLPQINMLSTNTACHNNTTGSEKNDSSMSSECDVESEGENVSGDRKARKSQTAAYGNSPINAREIRDKARARARERTREKMMIRCLEKSKQFYLSDHQTSTTTYNLAKLGSSTAENPNSNLETVQESSMSSYTTRERTNSPHEYSSSHSSLHHQMADVGIIASSSAAPATSCSIFDFQENDALFSGGLDYYSNKFLGFLGNWDIKNSNNSEITTNMVPTLTEKGKVPTLVFTENSKFLHFQSQYPAE